MEVCYAQRELPRVMGNAFFFKPAILKEVAEAPTGENLKSDAQGLPLDRRPESLCISSFQTPYGMYKRSAQKNAGTNCAEFGSTESAFSRLSDLPRSKNYTSLSQERGTGISEWVKEHHWKYIMNIVPCRMYSRRRQPCVVASQ